MTEKTHAPADDARGEGLIVVAPVTHTFDPGYRAPLAVLADAFGGPLRYKLDKPDLTRCSHCGMPALHRYHGGNE